MQIHIVHINKDSFIFSKIVSQKYDAQIARTPAQVWGLIIGISLIIPYHFAIQSTHHLFWVFACGEIIFNFNRLNLSFLRFKV